MPAKPQSAVHYQDASLPVEVRVRDLLGRMTLAEKIRQMSMADAGSFVSRGGVSARALRERFGKMGIGCLQDPRMDAATSAAVINAVQRYLIEETRLGIPALVISECLHGHMSGGTTVFPQAIGLASTWNPELIGRMASAIAREARAVGVAQALAPDLDLARDPRWGRVEETYGEDPYLVEQMGVAYIRGMQGEGPLVDRKHLVCTPKHFAAHGSPEAGMNLAPVAGGLHDLYTLYLPPFEAAIRRAGALSVMPCYSEYEGIPAHASKLLLTRVLREEWGFQGYVFADYGAVAMLETFHRTAHDATEAGKQALEAGLDLEAPSDYGYGQALLEAVEKGEVAEALVDQAVGRILRVKFLAGLFENPYADEATVTRTVHCAAHRKLAREVAQESIVLLRNEGPLLPLDPKALRRIAVIGPNADVAQMGDYTLTSAVGVTPLEGIRAAVGKRVEVVHARGCPLWERSTDGFAEAVAAAESSDVAIVVIGGASMALAGTGWGTSSEIATCGEGFDRTELTPPGVQEDLVRAIHATGTPTVVVMVHGRPYSIAWMAEHIPAILDAWYPGEEGGHALADVLFGRVNPSGKLPITVPRSVGHVPAFYSHKPSARGFYKRPGSPDCPGRDYVFAPPDPLYEFGFGLSYTTFAYSDLRVTPDSILPAGHVEVCVSVQNTGERPGKEVVQLYVDDVVSSVTTPVKVLRGFQKVALGPGESTEVRFTLGPRDLRIRTAEGQWLVEPGEFRVLVGGLEASFHVRKP
ncbi:MAG: glycosyl hydrolase [Armatimonadetes bacterium]|nr:glycosyl hydrolase [Armatimonadota bacterium]